MAGARPARDALKYHERLGTSLALELMPWYMRKPVLASVQGHALEAGCALAMFCDLTITADDAMFGEHRPLQSTRANNLRSQEASIRWPSIAADEPTLSALL